ncbi:MAG: L-rhamnose isomerase [Opitutales bacterium]
MSSKLFDEAKALYAEHGVDVEAALETLASTPVSLHCWQGDDVGGFENPGGELGGGLAVTGNYPGKARTLDELRSDMEQVFSLVPGRHHVNVHAIYGDFSSGKADRDAIEPKHFQSWIDWCKQQGLGFDFNPTCFGHEKADDGLTLSHPDKEIRRFWIDHCKACRRIGAEAGKQLGKPCVTNIWIPDGFKDMPADRKAYRTRLRESLDSIFETPVNPEHNRDAVESKLFGIGSEAFVVGNHEFYYGYAIQQRILYCLDAGHFHPTEEIAEKFSSVLQFLPEIMLHVSRGVRWDSDHVVVLDDPTKAIFRELVRGDYLGRTHIGLDFFDASINRIAAWVIGLQATKKALLLAALEPHKRLSEMELQGDFSSRLALIEEMKALPFGVIWNEFCRRENRPEGLDWMREVKKYEETVLRKR